LKSSLYGFFIDRVKLFFKQFSAVCLKSKKFIGESPGLEPALPSGCLSFGGNFGTGNELGSGVCTL
jgi:hypothetical protein